MAEVVYRFASENAGGCGRTSTRENGFHGSPSCSNPPENRQTSMSHRAHLARRTEPLTFDSPNSNTNITDHAPATPSIPGYLGEGQRRSSSAPVSRNATISQRRPDEIFSLARQTYDVPLNQILLLSRPTATPQALVWSTGITPATSARSPAPRTATIPFQNPVPQVAPIANLTTLKAS